MATRIVVVGMGSRGQDWLREVQTAPGYELVAASTATGRRSPKRLVSYLCQPGNALRICLKLSPKMVATQWLLPHRQQATSSLASLHSSAVWPSWSRSLSRSVFISDYPGLSKIMHSLKGRSARECNEILARSESFWEHESFDHVIESTQRMRQA